MSAFSPSPQNSTCSKKIAVVIPCFQVEKTISGVLRGIGADVDQIICVDDLSDDNSAFAIESEMKRDHRIALIQRSENGGVGAATMDGYRAAIDSGADVIVKIDGPRFAGAGESQDSVEMSDIGVPRGASARLGR